MKDRAVFMFLRHNLGIMLVLLLLVVLLSALSPVFLTPNNLLTVLKQISHNMCLALGMTLVIILGGIDLSVGALVAMIGTVTVGLIVNQGVPIFVGILMGLFLGIICGAINGGFVAFFKFPAFIVTLSMMNIARGVAYIYCGGKTTRIMDERFVKIGTGSLGLVPVPVIYMLVMIVIFSILLNKTKFGTYIYAIGGNREAARLSGVPIKLTEIAVFTIAGFMASFAGIVLAARMYSGQPSVGDGHELNAIAACVLGGISMSGGVGRIGGTVMGVLVMGVINNGLNLLNVSTYWQYVAKGAIILIAVMVDWMKQRSKVKV
ncbi:ABC transporter permease [Enterocloster lavalensis]|uniref:ABC transporter permease n=1 Tax=Enterocloster lavalensis TaxID=460384 RepID=UPI001D067A6C|nr:ABC transporter permease [Enterocloster lavalensis]MBS5603989.1 ABC transporter permease [Enterocloster asparagiformis]MCB6345212.1 ABC transporter permease [Enterocloster lavalensis]